MEGVNKVVNSAINTSKSTDKYNVGMVKQNFPKKYVSSNYKSCRGDTHGDTMRIGRQVKPWLIM